MTMHPAPLPQVTTAPALSRALSAFELLLGALIVIGHNIYKVVPNEVPILFLLGLLSLRIRDGGWGVLGMKRPVSWRWTIAIALGAATLRILMAEFVTDPLEARLWPAAAEVTRFDAITGNLKLALLGFVVIWTFAAFGEEIAYRGYLLTRAADLGRRSSLAYWAGLVAVSVLFGIGHYYKGPGGMIDSGMAGFIIGSAYLLSGRNLWVAILAHGFIDTFGLILVYLGLHK